MYTLNPFSTLITEVKDIITEQKLLLDEAEWAADEGGCDCPDEFIPICPWCEGRETQGHKPECRYVKLRARV